MKYFSKTKNSKAFTLIELLVVISIIGFLSSVVLASLLTARDKANDSRVAQDLRQFGIAQQLYFEDNKVYAFGDKDTKVLAVEKKDNTFSSDELNIFSIRKAEAAYTDAKCTAFVTSANKLVAGKYLSSVPKHPKDDGATICYKQATTSSNLVAYGQLSTKTSWSPSTYKETGIVLGDITVSNLQAIYTATGSQYPSPVGGGNYISDMALLSDQILGSVNSNTASASSSLYTITVNTTGNGTVTKSPSTTTYAPGAYVTLTASPASGYAVSWTGCTSSYMNSCYVTMGTLNVTIGANFVQGYSVSVMSTTLPSATNYGFSPNGNSYTSYGTAYPSSYYYAPGTSVTVSAAAPSGYVFSGFPNCSSYMGTNSGVGTTNGSCTFTMPSSNVNLSATFSPTSFSNSVSVSSPLSSATNYSFYPQGSSYTSLYGTTAYPTSYYYAPNTFVTVYMMSAPSGYVFSGFSNCSSYGGTNSGIGTQYGSCAFTMPSTSVNLTATFTQTL